MFLCCRSVELTCWNVELTCWNVELTCWNVELAGSKGTREFDARATEFDAQATEFDALATGSGGAVFGELAGFAALAGGAAVTLGDVEPVVGVRARGGEVEGAAVPPADSQQAEVVGAAGASLLRVLRA